MARIARDGTVGRARWGATWERALPALALAGPGVGLVAALIRAAGIGTLGGELDWISEPGGLVLTYATPFMVATFFVLGRRIADQSFRLGLAVTGLGVAGVINLAFIAQLRLFLGTLTDNGFDPDALNAAFESPSAWELGLLPLNAVGLLTWMVAGIGVLKTKVAPAWSGVALVLGTPAVITAQAVNFQLELFWPLGMALWLAGVWGVVRSDGAQTQKPAAN